MLCHLMAWQIPQELNLPSFAQCYSILWGYCQDQNYSGSGQIIGISLKAINSSKRVLKITGPALSRINSVIISEQTVCLGLARKLAHLFRTPWDRKCCALVQRVLTKNAPKFSRQVVFGHGGCTVVERSGSIPRSAAKNSERSLKRRELQIPCLEELFRRKEHFGTRPFLSPSHFWICP